MSQKIDLDHGRFRQIIRGKIKQNLRKYISQGEMIAKKGKDAVSIPLPSVDIPTIVVIAARPGADPETMANSVAAPLERRLGEISGVTEITSTSSIGNTSVVVPLRNNSSTAASSSRQRFRSDTGISCLRASATIQSRVTPGRMLGPWAAVITWPR